jgi:hypothetical protein
VVYEVDVVAAEFDDVRLVFDRHDLERDDVAAIA